MYFQYITQCDPEHAILAQVQIVVNALTETKKILQKRNVINILITLCPLDEIVFVESYIFQSQELTLPVIM